MSTEETVDKIVEAIDCSTMLGAGWDCLSPAAKERFKQMRTETKQFISDSFMLYKREKDRKPDTMDGALVTVENLLSQ